MCGLLLRSMYGTQDASQICRRTTPNCSEANTGSKETPTEPSSTTRSRKPGRSCTETTSYCLETRMMSSRWIMDVTLKSRYDCKSGGVLGPDDIDDSEVTYLNR
eukprot:5844953-Amphidinium_carterae.1